MPWSFAVLEDDADIIGHSIMPVIFLPVIECIEIKLDDDARLKAIVDKSVLDAVTTGDRELHAKKKDLA